jgi:hypothetical protein
MYSQSTRVTFISLCPNNKGLGNYRDTHYTIGMDDLPFRWSLENRTSLGTLIDGPFSPVDPDFLHELTLCCARIVAFSQDSELCFVGRSPEHCFDYLRSGENQREPPDLYPPSEQGKSYGLSLAARADPRIEEQVTVCSGPFQSRSLRVDQR